MRQRIRICSELVSLFPGDDTLVEQFRVAVGLVAGVKLLRAVPRQICFRLTEQRLVTLQVSLELRQLRLKRPRIDRKEKGVFLDVIAFLEMDVDQRAADLRLYRDRRIRLNVADHRNLNGYVLLDNTSGHDRDSPAALASSSAALAARGSAVLRLRRFCGAAGVDQRAQSQAKEAHPPRFYTCLF